MVLSLSPDGHETMINEQLFPMFGALIGQNGKKNVVRTTHYGTFMWLCVCESTAFFQRFLKLGVKKRNFFPVLFQGFICTARKGQDSGNKELLGEYISYNQDTSNKIK